jgi:hypothetical protein
MTPVGMRGVVNVVIIVVATITELMETILPARLRADIFDCGRNLAQQMCSRWCAGLWLEF